MLIFQKYQLKIIKNEKAVYSFAELKDYIDFDVKRVYSIQDCSGATGQHCHKQEKEFFMMQCGSCVAIIDQGKGKEDIVLRGPGDAIYVGNYVWHGFKNFSPNALLIALSSTNYNPSRADYIEDYQQYIKLIQENMNLNE